MQANIPRGGVVVPLIFYSDKTTLDDLHLYSSHPLHITFGNMPLEAQHQLGGHALLAYMPILKEDNLPGSLRGEQFRKRSHLLTQQVLEAILGGLGGAQPRTVNRPIFSSSACLLC